MENRVIKPWLIAGFAMFVIGFGANDFAAMLQIYRAHHFTQADVTAMLGIYAAGLVPALIVGGPYSDRRGRRGLLSSALFLSALGSAVIAFGSVFSPLIFLGRFLVGIAVGAAMASGSAWIKELSTDSPQAGARRATMAVSAGFGGGPVVAGALADFLPLSQILPYIVHMSLAIPMGITIMRLRAPFAVLNSTDSPRPPLVPRTLLKPRFLWAVAAWAPWVFGTATVFFATLTSLVADSISHKAAYTGLIAGMTMLTGVFIQPLAKRLHSTTVSQYLPLATVGLLCACTGMIVATFVATTRNPWLVIAAALCLGASYGIMMVSGLQEVESFAEPHELGAAIGIFYALTYLGFAVPFLLSLIAPLAGGYAPCFIFGAIVCVASIYPVAKAATRAELA